MKVDDIEVIKASRHRPDEGTSSGYRPQRGLETVHRHGERVLESRRRRASNMTWVQDKVVPRLERDIISYGDQ